MRTTDADLWCHRNGIYPYSDHCHERYRAFLMSKSLMNQAQIPRNIPQQQALRIEGLILGAVVIALILLNVAIWRFTTIFLNRFSKRKSKRVGRVTRAPTIPFSQHNLFEYEGPFNTTNVIPEVRILCSKTSKKYCKSKKINTLMKELFNIKTRFFDDPATKRVKKQPIPTSARLISIKMTGFDHGDACHEFIPIDGTVPGSHLTYQMYGDNRIQITYYVEGGVSYVAGFCIFFKSTGLRDAEFPTEIIRKAWGSVQKYAGRRHEPISNVQTTDENVGLLTQQNETGIVFCSRLNSNVISSVNENSVSHQEFDEEFSRMQMKQCLECSGKTEKDAPPAYSSLTLF